MNSNADFSSDDDSVLHIIQNEPHFDIGMKDIMSTLDFSSSGDESILQIDMQKVENDDRFRRTTEERHGILPKASDCHCIS